MLNADDELHEKATRNYQEMMKAGRRFMSSTAVLNEVANALSRPKFRTSVVELYKRLQKSQRVEILFVDENTWASGWDLYENRPDKEWSLTDCISIVMMQEQSLKDPLTTDKHFQQAGLNALLRK